MGKWIIYRDEEYLAHHGIKGQRWGVRRYQNADGTLTEEGKKKYRKLQKELFDIEQKYQKDVKEYFGKYGFKSIDDSDLLVLWLMDLKDIKPISKEDKKQIDDILDLYADMQVDYIPYLYENKDKV